jgi:hypothetical protein
MITVITINPSTTLGTNNSGQHQPFNTQHQHVNINPSALAQQ